ncbi:MAG: winged helix-turn-helix transcriptional regulator [Nitrospirae bacterium]|nr:winged helix-turn-helix transcriptional regulator [Nitrospirota bacterium]
MNVHRVNNEKSINQSSYKSLRLLEEIAKGEPLSQRDLSKKLDIALGLINSYMKNLVSRGYITIKEIPAKRYSYFLTPKGFAEKTRLTYQHLQNYTSIYKQARRDFRVLLKSLEEQGIRRVVFAGVDEVAEIAYLSLQEVEITLAGVVDDGSAGHKFFRGIVAPVREIHSMEYDRVILSTFLRREEVFRNLLENGVPEDRVCAIYDARPGKR